jgi:C_GCAxxG_C_C family probable redox protein
MSERVKEVRDLFTRCNCSQAVLTTFGPELGLGQTECMKVAACFGAGMGRMGKTCGALTGGFMVLGLRHAHEMMDDPQKGRDSVYGRVQALTQRFVEAHGSSECLTLTGCNLLTAEGRKSFAECDLHKGLCANLVASVVEFLEEETPSNR